MKRNFIEATIDLCFKVATERGIFVLRWLHTEREREREREREMKIHGFVLAMICLVAICQAQNSPQDFVAAHNAARSQVGVGPLSWSYTVAAYARNYANKRVGDCALRLSGGPYGENIFWSASPDSTAADAVGAFTAEMQNYEYESNRCASGTECGHYTQVVWRNSVWLGCGRVTCNDGSIFFTCNYDPPGNVVGERPGILHFIPTTFLDAHNAARFQVGVEPLSWNDAIVAYAQRYAYIRVNDCALTHSGGPYGENIFWGPAADFTAIDALNAWVAEKQYYDYDSNSCGSGQQCGNYTQVVWRNSLRLGCARVRCSNGGIFITCNYDPPGNYAGQRPYVSGGKKHAKGFIAIIIIPIVLAVIPVGLCGIFLGKRKLKGKGTDTASHHNLFSSSEVREGRNSDQELSLFDLSVVAAATNNFSDANKLGEGGFGPVYKGMLPGGQVVAVKRLSMKSQQGRHEFKNEVVLISKLQHRNLVRLLGCCIQGEENILIYEYMPNKSLDFFLFGLAS